MDAHPLESISQILLFSLSKVNDYWVWADHLCPNRNAYRKYFPEWV